MTRDAYLLLATARRHLAAGPWPPVHRWAVDTAAAIITWQTAGQHIYRLRPGAHAPAIAPDLPLATAPLARSAVAYIMPEDRATWIILARVPAQQPMRMTAERTLAMSQTILAYVGRDGDGAPAGYISLEDQPTPRHLRLIPGRTWLDRDQLRPMATVEIGWEAVRLAQCLPWFFATST